VLLQVLDPGLIGGLLLPVLGALPDSAIIVVSGMGGTVAEAQEQVLSKLSWINHTFVGHDWEPASRYLPYPSLPHLK
jgi:hypothetical protein